MVDQPPLTSWLGCDEMSESLCDLGLHFNVYSHPHPFRLYLSIVSNVHAHMKPAARRQINWDTEKS